jgi:metal-responsive CopG/Arc/MetJ family transcriptional regulator
MAKISIDDKLFDRAKRAAENAGYSSVDEFITHCLEKGIEKHAAEAEAQVSDQLRGLGYIE